MANTDALRVQTDAILSGYGRRGQIFVVTMYGVIILSMVTMMMLTMEDIRAKYERFLILAEYFISIFFFIEYCLRVWSAPNRRRYIFSFWGIIDFAAGVLAMFFLQSDLNLFQTMRAIRIIQLLKFMRLGRADAHLKRAFNEVKGELLIFGIMAGFVLYFGAVGIYHFEHEAQPEAFGSIPASLWWSLATLTTVGYGDVYPITPGGKIFTAVLLFFGLAIIAVPTGLFSAALVSTKRPPQSEE